MSISRGTNARHDSDYRDDVTATRCSQDIDPGNPLGDSCKRLVPDRVLEVIKTSDASFLEILCQWLFALHDFRNSILLQEQSFVGRDRRK